MAIPLIGTGGSKGVRELGMGTNQALTDSILRLSSQVTQENIQKTKAAQFIQGKARVAQGESLETIKQSQGVFDQIFGYGTIAGAEAQTVIQATDKHVLDMQLSMDKYKELSTEEFIASQRQYVTENLVTGNPTVDALIVEASAESIADATSLHAKSRAMFIQEKNKIAFEQTVLGASQRVNASLIDPEIALQDKIKSLESFAQRIQPSYGQTGAAYINSMYDTSIAELKSDRPEMFQALVRGVIPVGDTDIETGEPLPFDAKQLQKLEEAYTAYEGRTNSAKAIEVAKGFAGLKELSKNPTVTTTEMEEGLGQFLDQNGADALTMTQQADLLIKHSNSILNETKTQNGVQDILSGASRTSTDKNTVQRDLNSTEVVLTRKFNTEEVEKIMIDLSKDNQLVPSSWTAQYNNGLVDLEDPLLFIRTMQSLDNKFKSDPKLFLKDMNNDAKTNYLAVKYIMESQGLEQSPERALIQYKKYQLSIEEAKEVSNTSDFNTKIDKFLSNPNQTPWYTFGLFDKYKDLRNPEELKQATKYAIIQQVARTGVANEASWSAAMHDISVNTEPVMNYAVRTHGTPLNTQAGISDPEVTFEDALTYYTETGNRFGIDFDPDFVDYKFTRGFVTITPTNEDGSFISGLPEHRVPYTEIGDVYNSEVLETNERAEKELALFTSGKLPVNWGSMSEEEKSAYFPTKEKQVGISNLDPDEYKPTALNVMQNKVAVEMALGASVDRAGNEALDVMQTLMHPSKGERVKSLLKTIPRQIQSGNTAGMSDSISAISNNTHGKQRDIKLMRVLEGRRNTAYDDGAGNVTIGVGFNMDQSGAKESWVKAGLPEELFDTVKSGKTELDDASIDKLRSYTLNVAENKASARATELGLDYNTFPNWKKLILTDVAFNTGSVKGWEKIFKAKSKIGVIKEARRTAGGKNTSGMDNRVAKIGYYLGIFKTLEEAKKYLPLATTIK